MKYSLKTVVQDKGFFKILLALAIPIMVQNLIVSSLNMVDTLMIGAVGENEVAAVGIANQFYFIYNLLMIGISTGCSVFISQFWGSENRKGIKKVIGLGMIIMTVVGTGFTLLALLIPGQIIHMFSRDRVVIQLGISYLTIVCFSYLINGITMIFSNALRSIGLAKLPMAASIVGILTNAVLNYILIFGKLGFPVMGVRGAAIGTVAARIAEMTIVLVFSLRKSSPLYGDFRSYLNLDLAFAKNVVRSMVPVVLNEGCWGLGFVLYTMAYGLLGTKAIAAVQICNTVQDMFMIVCFSMASASLVMTGNQIGAGKKEVARRYAWNFVVLAFCVGIVIGIGMILLAPNIVLLFKISPEAQRYAMHVLRIFAVLGPLRATSSVLIVGIFRGAGDAASALKIEVVCMWLVGVPAAFLGAGVFHLQMEYVAMLISLEEFLKFFGCTYHFKRGKWIKDVTAQLA